MFYFITTKTKLLYKYVYNEKRSERRKHCALAAVPA